MSRPKSWGRDNRKMGFIKEQYPRQDRDTEHPINGRSITVGRSTVIVGGKGTCQS